MLPGLTCDSQHGFIISFTILERGIYFPLLFYWRARTTISVAATYSKQIQQNTNKAINAQQPSRNIYIFYFNFSLVASSKKENLELLL